MMRINLLPVRAARRQVSARQELLIMSGTLVVIIAGLFAWWTVETAKISDMQERVDTVRAEMETVKKDVIRVQEFKTKAELLERKLKVIEELKLKKIGPAKMLDDLAAILTDERKVWLTKLVEKDGTMTLEGGAMEEQNISEFQIALTKRSKIFSQVRLNVVTAQKINGVPYLTWIMVCKANYAAG
ncbi:MAG: PilN domain-containing protein [Deltaproteobacteria bacterium]|nr:PilN domain-containing protein [Deltaproteobacteria bacterium]